MRSDGFYLLGVLSLLLGVLSILPIRSRWITLTVGLIGLVITAIAFLRDTRASASRYRGWEFRGLLCLRSSRKG